VLIQIFRGFFHLDIARERGSPQLLEAFGEHFIDNPQPSVANTRGGVWVMGVQ